VNDLALKQKMDNLIAFIGLAVGLLLMQVNKQIPTFDYSEAYPLLAAIAGAYGKMYKDWQTKSFKQLAFNASASISLGLIIGGVILEHYNPTGEWTRLACFSLGAIIALFVVDAIIFISSRLTDNSWKIFKRVANIPDADTEKKEDETIK
jgi:MFS family permease